jgi:hypothetical protein
MLGIVLGLVDGPKEASLGPRGFEASGINSLSKLCMPSAKLALHCMRARLRIEL